MEISQSELIELVVQRTFIEKTYNYVFLTFHNAQLASLLACVFSMVEIKAPFSKGLNCYLPSGEGELFLKVKINNLDGEYYSFFQKKGKQPVAKSLKKRDVFERECIVAAEQEDDQWIFGKNISRKFIKRHPGCIYPTIVGSSRSSLGFSSYLKLLELRFSETKTLGEKLSISGEEFKDKIKFLSPSKYFESDSDNFIWVNRVPQVIDDKRHIIFLSPDYYRFSEFDYELGELFQSKSTIHCLKEGELDGSFRKVYEKFCNYVHCSIWKV